MHPYEGLFLYPLVHKRAFLSKCMYACTRVSPVRGARIRKWRQGQLIKEEEGDLT